MSHPPTTAVEGQINRYLDQIAAGLPGPRRRHSRVLAELRDGLEQAVADHTARGLSPERAVTAATAQFGSPDAITAAFAGELATAYARQILIWFVASGPFVGVWWLFLLRPDPWRAGLVALLAAIPVVPLVVAGIATAAGALATTGRLIRWLPEASAQRALAAARAVAALAATADLVIIGLYLRSDIPARALSIIAIAASLTRIGCSLVTIRRATALRNRLANQVPAGARW
jgi:hypothetical protein